MGTNVFLWSGLVSLALFIVLFVYTIVQVSKGRAEVRRRLRAAYDFAGKINQDGDKDYYYLDSGLVDENGNAVEFPEECGAYELVMSGFSIKSEMPSKCCRITIEDVKMKHDQFGRCFGHEPIQFFIRPAQNFVSQWRIVSVWDDRLVCEHPIMGRLYLFRSNRNKDFFAGQTIDLLSMAEKRPDGYRLWYLL